MNVVAVRCDAHGATVVLYSLNVVADPSLTANVDFACDRLSIFVQDSSGTGAATMNGVVQYVESTDITTITGTKTPLPFLFYFIISYCKKSLLQRTFLPTGMNYSTFQ